MTTATATVVPEATGGRRAETTGGRRAGATATAEATRGARPDGRLVEAQLDGNPRAFDALYRRYRDRLVQFCSQQSGDRHLAEDLAQEAMIRYLETADTFDTSRPVWPWLRTIARNLVIDHHRRTEEYLDLDAGPDPVVDDAEDPTVRLDRVEEQSHLGPMLDQLPRRQRIALSLHYGQDWTRDEVADYFDIKVNACDQLLYRARRNAREYYDNEPTTSTPATTPATTPAAAPDRGRRCRALAPTP